MLRAMPRRARLLLGGLCALFFAHYAWHALSRFASVHNHTFDLAMYARSAWGLAHGQPWNSLSGVHFLGSHLAFVLWPLGWLGRWLQTVPVLLFAQALCLAWAALPCARIGARRLGEAGALVGGLCWLLYPNLGHVASYEFHPGSLAMLPLCWAVDALDRGHGKHLLWFALAVVACRADFALATLMLGVVSLGQPSLRRTGRLLCAASLGYLVLRMTVLLPMFAPPGGSSELHFGHFGGSPLGVLPMLFRDPSKVLDHFLVFERLRYPLLLLGPLGLLALWRPRMLLLSLPFVALNMLSQFPTATRMYSHYLTPILPGLVAATLDGWSALQQRFAWGKRVGLAWLALCLACGSVLSGGLRWSLDFPAQDYRADSSSAEAQRMLSSIPAQASVQGPDRLLPHLIARPFVYRGPPPERRSDFVFLDVSHRERYAQSVDLLRTIEEPLMREWLGKPDHAVIAVGPSLLLLQRGRSPRQGLAERYFMDRAPERDAVLLSDCLSLLGAQMEGSGLTLWLWANGACPNDLALRLGAQARPHRVDLLFDGVLSPVHLRAGDRLQSFHPLSEAEREGIVSRGLWVGVLRTQGAPPQPSDPYAVRVERLRQEPGTAGR